jgi:hypothetical protein
MDCTAISTERQPTFTELAAQINDEHRQSDDLETLVRSWMQRTSKPATVAAILLESVAKKLRAEEGQT